MVEIQVYPDSVHLMRAAAEVVTAAGQAAIAAQRRFNLVLAGGETPAALYSLLAADPYAARLDWEAVHVFWGDERCVPPHHPESNYRMARETLLDHVPIPPHNIHRMRGEDDPVQAALVYQDELRAHFNGPPRFDLVLLGMGADGHTASLFPGAPALAERVRLAVAVFATHRGSWRVTLTYPALNAAALAVFLVSGSGKAETLRAVLEGPQRPADLPAQAVRPTSGRLLWLADADAARLLSRPAARSERHDRPDAP